jgi:hypothetical protein
MGGGSAIMTLLDQYTRECLCIHADRSRTGEKSVKDMKRLIGLRSAPESITSDSGSEFAGQTRDVRRTKREYLRSSIEIPESQQARIIGFWTESERRISTFPLSRFSGRVTTAESQLIPCLIFRGGSRAPNLNLSAASFFGAGQNGKLLHFSLY